MLCESTTNTSSAHATERRQRSRLAASFLIGTRMETGTRGWVIGRGRDGSLFDDARRVADGDRVRRHVARHDRHRADDRPRPDAHPRQHERARADERILAHAHRRGLQRDVRVGEIVRAGAQVGFLRDGGARADLDLAEAVGARAVAERGAVVHGEFPGNLDARPLVDERAAVQGRAEGAQHGEPPRVHGFGGPHAEQHPGIFPQQEPHPLPTRPRRGEGAGLLVGVERDGHGEDGGRKAEGLPLR